MNIFDTCSIPRKFTNIQSFGLLIVLDRNNLKIQGFSKNVPIELDFTKDELYELQNFTKIIKQEFQDIFYNYLLYKVDKKSTRVILLCNEKEYYCHTYKSNQYIIVELEEKSDSIDISIEHIFNIYNEFTNKSKDIIVKIIKDITNFKRVMLYEFNADWSGLVTVENSDYINQETFLNVYFHETDIPHYVRGLYCKNPIRYINNINDNGIEIDWLEPETLDKVDASSSEVINTTKSHKTYLKIMDATTSFSIAILVNNKLWGLVICHNDTPKYISPSIRQQCYQFVNMVSNNITNSINSMESNFNSYIHEIYKFTSIFNFTSIKETENLLNLIINKITTLIDADYFIGNLECNILFDKTHLLYYIITSNLNKIDNIFYSDNIQKDFKDLFNISIPSECCKCIIIIKLNKMEWIAFIKKGKIKVIQWAGKNEVYLENGITFPRRDFSIYNETIIYSDSFKLTNNNIIYLRQLFVFFMDRINGINIFNEYFMTQDKNKQMLLFSNITHEIRNPLNAIIGLFDLLKLDKSDINNIIDDGIMISNQLLELISNLINATKYSYNNTLTFKVINWDDIINTCINTYKYILKPNVKLYSKIDKNLPICIGDTIKIQQILSNLISNSVKFTEKGEIVIEIYVVNKIEDTNWIRIKVIDTGIGILKDKQIRLFQTFEQANTEFIHSSGIGLSVCLQLVTLLNGSITFESEYDVGTTFHINLPLTTKKLIGNEIKLTTFEPKEIPLNILVVEDNRTNQKILEIKLKNKKHNVHCANNGNDAIEIIKNNEIIFDLILMDLQMIGLDGIQTTNLLRNKYNFKKPIVATTGHSFDNKFYTKNGFDDVIIKPIDYYKLYKIIYNIQSELK